MTKLGAGGISTLTVNIQSIIDREKVNFDYLVFEDKSTFYEDKVYKMGGNKKIVNVEAYHNKLLQYWAKYKLTKKLINKEKYDIVHVDASTPMDVVIGFAAKHAGARVRIIHSHIAGDNKHSIIRTIYMNICRSFMPFVFTDFFSISKSAALFMFPRNIVKRNNYSIIKNGIVAEKYKYIEETRLKLRNELGISDSFVMGHIGRFSAEKNHDFILDVFKKIHEINVKSKLLLIGDGLLRNKIEDKIHKLGIEEDVILYGTSQEVPSMLMAMDSFLFPSKYEGLGIAAIEAQCSGLPTFCSDGIPEETNISDLFIRVNGYSVNNWVDAILEFDYNRRRESMHPYSESWDIHHPIIL